MPKAIDVQPKKWSNLIVLSDDGEYSYCWGAYERGNKRILGERWNNNYPRQGSSPTWYIPKHSMHKIIIQGIITELMNKKSSCNDDDKLDEIEEYLSNCKIALDEIG